MKLPTPARNAEERQKVIRKPTMGCAGNAGTDDTGEGGGAHPSQERPSHSVCAIHSLCNSAEGVIKTGCNQNY